MSAIYYQLLTGVQTNVGNLAGTPPVVLRKKLALTQGDPSALVIVAPGRGGEKPDRLTYKSATTFGQTGVNYVYPVAVALIEPNDEALSANLAAYLLLRQSIRNLLFTVAPAGIVQPGYDVELDPDEVAEFGAFLGTNYDVTGWLVKYRTVENLTSN